VNLVEAIGALFHGVYGMVPVDVRMAMVPPNERSPDSLLPVDPFYQRCTLPLLRRALREAAAEPVRPYPHFGPVVFTEAAR
jgi:hypothetical protein